MATEREASGKHTWSLRGSRIEAKVFLMIFVCYIVCIRNTCFFTLSPRLNLFFFYLVLISSCFSVVCFVVAPFPCNGQIKRCTYKSKLSCVVLFWSIDFVVSSDPIEILRIQMHFKNGNITWTLVFNIRKSFFMFFFLKKRKC